MDYLQGLTAAQREAVTHVDGPLLVIAGPGSGKTRVVTCRMAHLLHEGIPSSSILALTFTNKAADEMRNRLRTLVPEAIVWTGTFHRFCSRLLRRHARLVGLRENFRIYDTDDSLKLLKSVIEDRHIDLFRHTPGQIARAISRAKSSFVEPAPPTGRASGVLDEIAAEIRHFYQQRLLDCNAVDFDDLLVHVVHLLRDNPELRASLDDQLQYILVDEYQDTNLAQYTIVRALSIDHPHLAVTGDPDQSIYAWRGADIKNILDFERDFPVVRVVRLEQNYRSTQRILQVADQLISNNHFRKVKRLFTENPPGDQVRLVRYEDGREEAQEIARQIADGVRRGLHRPSDFAILLRTNALSRNFEHVLRREQIPYRIVNGVEFYQRKEVKDVLAYLQLINNDRDDVALQRIINVPPRSVGQKSLQVLRDHAWRQQWSLLEACQRCSSIPALAARAKKAVRAFAETMQRLQADAAAQTSVAELVNCVLEQTGYRQVLADSSDEEDRQRVANLDELCSAAHDFDLRFEQPAQAAAGQLEAVLQNALETFLEQVALVADTDALDGSDEHVLVMTLHSAKGLEFPVVYIAAVEHGVLPHERSMNDPMAMEEERRLLFVGITRAMQRLQLSLARRRDVRGVSRSTIPSLFLMELPRHQMHHQGISAGHRPSFPRCGDDGNGGAPWDRDSLPEHGKASSGIPAFTTRATPAPQLKTSSASKGLMTAAQLLELQTGQGVAGAEKRVDALGRASRAGSPAELCPGELVIHPEHGPGRVLSVTGRGAKMMATVQMLQSPESQPLRLRSSSLRRLSGEER